MSSFVIGIVGQVSGSAAIGICLATGEYHIARHAGMEWRAMADGGPRARIGELLREVAEALHLSSRHELARLTEKAVVAVSGIDSRFSTSVFEQSMKMLGFSPVAIETASLAQVSHLGVFLGGPGCLLRCGHGASVFVKYPNDSGRVHGGWGAIAGDRGSGPWIGRKAMIAVTEVLDGDTDRLKREFCAALLETADAPDIAEPIDLVELIEEARFCEGELGVRRQLNTIGGYTIGLAKTGDAIAQSIVKRSWDRIVAMVEFALVRRHEQLNTGFRGGIVETFPYYRQGLQRELVARHPQINVNQDSLGGTSRHYSPIIGAALMALSATTEDSVTDALSSILAPVLRDLNAK